jgi:hypothetical protein
LRDHRLGNWQIKAGFALLAGALMGVSVYAAFGLPAHREPPNAKMPSPDSNAAVSPSRGRQAITSPRPTSIGPATLPPLPENVQRAIDEELPQLHSERDLERYLGELEARARQKRQVTALEVEPGMRAIQRYAPPEKTLETRATFSQRMAALSKEYSGQPDPSPENLPELANRIENASDNDMRRNLLRRYLQEAHRKPFDERLAAMERLSRITNH